MGIKITDLVDMNARQQLTDLLTTFDEVRSKYVQIANELVNGINIKVTIIGDLEKLDNLVRVQSRQLVQATQQMQSAVAQQNTVLGNTTNTISRALAEQEKLNKQYRVTESVTTSWKQATDAALGTNQSNIALLVEYEQRLKEINASMREVEASQKSNTITDEEAKERLTALKAESIELKIAKQELNKIINNEEKANQAAEGSYKQLSLELERMKMAYKEMNEEEKQSDAGQELAANITILDNQLKDAAADMGEFQRNVGNYAIAAQAGVSNTDALATALNTEATDAKTAAEQNTILREALEKIRQTTPNATEQINQLSQKIQQNENVIKSHTQASEGLVNTMGKMLGVNGKFGSSLQSLAANASNGGSVITGLTGKIGAMGKTLMGLLANPYVLAFLGIAGVAAGFKWWYDYNKGLVEASRQTKYFTGLTGDAMKSVRDNVQAVADTFNQDFTNTLHSANAIAQNFGISVNDATDLIAKGFAAGGTNSEQFLSNLERFAPTMQKMGMSAEEMVATLSQIDKAGVNSQRALTAMGKASLQLRTMNDSTSKSLKQIGIDANEMSKAIQDGSMSVNTAMGTIAQKLQEVGTNSQEAAVVMKDLFGARGESAIGEGFIDFLAESNKGMEELLGKEDSLQRLKLQEVETDKELNDVMASLFDMTGGGFESITTRCKIWIKQGLIAAIKWVVDLINYFIDWYNESLTLRAVIQYIVLGFKQMWEAAKLACNLIVDALKGVGRFLQGLGDMVEGVFTLNTDKITGGWDKLMQNYKTTFKEAWGDIENFGKATAQNVADAWVNTMKQSHIEHLNYNAVGDADVSGGGNGKPTPKGTGGNGGGGGGGSDASSKRQKEIQKMNKDAEKAAQDAAKAAEQLEEAQIQAMEEGLTKTLALIRLQYKKKIEAIKGNSENEKKLRLQYQEDMDRDLANATTKYLVNQYKINLENRLAAAKEASKEEYDLKFEKLQNEYQAELASAKATGADTHLIDEKYKKLSLDLMNDYYGKRLAKMQETAATAQIVMDNQLKTELNALNEQQAQELEMAGNNAEKIAAIKEKYQNKSAELQEKYAITTAQAQMQALKDQLTAFNIADGEISDLLDKISQGEIDAAAAVLEAKGFEHDDALNLAKSLASAEVQIDDAVTAHKLANIERVTDAATKARDARIANAEKWLSAVGEACNNINDLISTLFDAQIAKIEEQQEANQQQHDAAIANIEDEYNKGLITQEESEIRKREIEEATAKREAELQKKKAQAEYKQALAEKANNISQIVIATSLGIMKASPNWVNMALVAAMGAIQLATAIAQPIKAYKRGTDYHPGGLAIVGDGGKREVVETNGKYWLTPKVPTLVEMPEGSKVFPDYLDFIANEPPVNYGDLLAALPLPDISPLLFAQNKPKVIVNNDYRALQRELVENNRLMKAMIKQQHRDAARIKYDQYRAERI